METNPHLGSTLDSFLAEEGVLEEFRSHAIKEVIAWQLQQAMQERRLSKNDMAKLMHTSRAQLNRLLDPKDGNVTIETLQRAAAVVGRKVQLQLVNYARIARATLKASASASGAHSGSPTRSSATWRARR
jgi:DNA-binding Xre family transcriptional regulator